MSPIGICPLRRNVASTIALILIVAIVPSVLLEAAAHSPARRGGWPAAANHESILAPVLLNLHLLRAFAALAVVYFHITSPNGLNLSPNIGSHGVDMFFVISGFIIAAIGARSPDRFLVRRFIRIVPFYWTATLAIFALSALVPQYFHSTRPDVVQLVCSLFFVPRQTSYSGMVPTLLLGWSLNYEMYFYVLFALALAIAPRIAPLTCSMAIVTIGLVI